MPEIGPHRNLSLVLASLPQSPTHIIPLKILVKKQKRESATHPKPLETKYITVQQSRVLYALPLLKLHTLPPLSLLPHAPYLPNDHLPLLERPCADRASRCPETLPPQTRRQPPRRAPENLPPAPTPLLRLPAALARLDPSLVPPLPDPRRRHRDPCAPRPLRAHGAPARPAPVLEPPPQARLAGRGRAAVPRAENPAARPRGAGHGRAARAGDEGEAGECGRGAVRVARVVSDARAGEVVEAAAEQHSVF